MMFGTLNLITIFLTGLLTGGLTCIAVQGGVLTTSLVQDKKNKINTLALLSFLVPRVIAYTLLGFLLGWVGSMLQVNLQTRIVLQFLVVIFMLGTALNLLNIHPFFEHFMIQPPRFLANIAYKESEKRSYFASAILGFLTVLIPCGATQAMMALAVASGNPLTGGAILLTFILGTTPLFFILGFLTLKLGAIFKKQFITFAAIILIFLSIFNFDATLALANSPVTIRSVLKSGYCIISYCFEDYSQLAPVTEQTITFTNTGYYPNVFAVNKGTQVTLHLVNKNATGCIQAFTVSALNLQKIVLPNTSYDITFTVPDKPGRITFTCSAGLYPGTIEII